MSQYKEIDEGRIPADSVTKNKFRLLVENSLAGFFIIQGGVFQYLNARFAEILGYDDPAELLGKAFWSVVHPDDQEMVKSRGILRERQDVEPSRYVYRALKKDGSIVWVNVGASHGTYRGKPANLGNVIDVSSLRHTGEALRRSEERYSQILEAINDGYYEVDLEGNLRFFNDSFVRIWGYPRDELMGMNYRRYTHGQDVPKVFRIFNSTYQTGRPTKAYSWEIVRQDGGTRQVELSVSLMEDEQGRPVGFRGIARDVTERMRVELELKRHRHHLEEMVAARTTELSRANQALTEAVAELRKTEERLIREKNFSRSVIDSLPGIFYVFDHNVEAVQWNRQLEQISGYSREEVAGRNALDFYPIDEQPLVSSRIQEVYDHGRSTVEANIITKDGQLIPHLLTGRRLRLGDGDHMVGLGVDISKRKEAEEALRHSERQLRQLSARLLEAQEVERKRVAQELHDGLGQSLSAIKISLERVCSALTPLDNESCGPLLGRLVPMVQDAVEEVRRIAMDLRPSMLDDLGILATISWFTREFSRIYGHIRLEKDIAVEEAQVPDPLTTVIYRILQEALNNLAKHSRADRADIALRKSGGELILSISDNGKGFDRAQVLDAESPGRGFGLASMRERTEMFGGIFRLDSSPGQGVRLEAVWPLEDEG
jgi:PAS domain S-box-containing protein